MREIQWLVDNVEKYKNTLVQKRFDSKKNTVAYVMFNGHPRVLKWFVPGLKQNMDIEFNVLKKGVSDLAIPSPFEKDIEHNVVVMSYILGHNVCDVLNDPQLTFEEKEKVMHHLADWFVRFHNHFKTEHGFHIRGDATLRNFIQNKGHIYGVDFEESRNGKPSEDLATLCGSLLSTNPMFTDEKFDLCQIFLNAYRDQANWSIDSMSAEISYALLERIQWRPSDEELLRKYATKIRTKGLQIARHNF